MKKERISQLYQAFKNGHLSKEESVEFEDLLNDSENKKEFDFYEKIWLASEKYPSPDTDTSWNSLHKKLQLNGEVKGSYPKKNWISYAAAAAVLFISAIVFNFLSPESESFATAQGEIRQFKLSDGSTVILNQNSSLVFETNGHQRKVTFSGEAFFEVAKNPQQPFEINGPNSSVKVIGTAFHLIDRESKAVVLLEVNEGLVEIKNSKGDKSLVKRGQKAIIKNEKINVKTSQHSFESDQWVNGELHFYDAELAEIFIQLENKFQIKINVSDPNILNCLFSGDFKKETPKEIIDNICVANNLSYQINAREIQITGKGCLND
jgi:ferric-dicitrate binding protein FerR (iron transport regulator)